MASDKDTSGSKPSATTAGSSTGGKTDGPSSAAKPTAAPSSAASAAKRPVTIDLKPEKVGAKTPEDKSPSAKAGSSPSGASSPSASAAKPSSGSTSSTPGTRPDAAAQKPSASGTSASATSASATSSAGSSTAQAKTGDGKSGASASSAAVSSKPATSGGSKAFSSPPPAPEKTGVGFGGVLAAALFGGVVVLAGAYGLYVSGVLTLETPQARGLQSNVQSAMNRMAGLEQKIDSLGAGSPSDADVGKRLDAVEKRIGALAASSSDESGAALVKEIDALKSSYKILAAKIGSRPAASGGSDEALNALDQRVAAIEGAAGKASSLESDVAKVSDSVTDIGKRLDSVEATAKAAQSAVSTSDVSLKTLAESQARASETLASLSADIRTGAEKQSADLAKIQDQLDAMSKRLAAVEATMGDATAREVAARALSVSALKSAVDSGRPYATELAAVKAGLPKGTDIAALETHASSGVAPVSVLIAEFPEVARAMFSKFSEPERSGDMLDSLLAGARSIIAVRGPGDENGDGPEAVLRRMENAVSSGNLAASLTAYAALPEDAKAVGSDWAARAEARVTVDRLTDAASAEVLNALSRKDS